MVTGRTSGDPIPPGDRASQSLQGPLGVVSFSPIILQRERQGPTGEVTLAPAFARAGSGTPRSGRGGPRAGRE